ncbi:MAG: hypothetical protein Q9225_007938 [Loekoesia sp. 1 TL-2023]
MSDSKSLLQSDEVKALQQELDATGSGRIHSAKKKTKPTPPEQLSSQANLADHSIDQHPSLQSVSGTIPEDASPELPRRHQASLDDGDGVASLVDDEDTTEDSVVKDSQGTNGHMDFADESSPRLLSTIDEEELVPSQLSLSREKWDNLNYGHTPSRVSNEGSYMLPLETERANSERASTPDMQQEADPLTTTRLNDGMPSNDSLRLIQSLFSHRTRDHHRQRRRISNLEATFIQLHNRSTHHAKELESHVSHINATTSLLDELDRRRTMYASVSMPSINSTRLITATGTPSLTLELLVDRDAQVRQCLLTATTRIAAKQARLSTLRVEHKAAVYELRTLSVYIPCRCAMGSTLGKDWSRS